MYQFMLYDNVDSYKPNEILVRDADDMNAMSEEDEYANTHERTLQQIWGGVPPPARVVYEYDMGDGWEHGIEFEGEVVHDQNAVVLEGSGRPAVEDCGGAYGWERYKVSEST